MYILASALGFFIIRTLMTICDESELHRERAVFKRSSYSGLIVCQVIYYRGTHSTPNNEFGMSPPFSVADKSWDSLKVIWSELLELTDCPSFSAKRSKFLSILFAIVFGIHSDIIDSHVQYNRFVYLTIKASSEGSVQSPRRVLSLVCEVDQNNFILNRHHLLLLKFFNKILFDMFKLILYVFRKRWSAFWEKH